MESPERLAVRQALDSLKPYLRAYLTQRGARAQDRGSASTDRKRESDIQSLLRLCLASWEDVLRRELPSVAKSYLHELIDIRNRWAHEESFSRLEVDRAVDTVRHFSLLIGAPPPNKTTVNKRVETRVKPKSGKRETQRDVLRRIFQSAGQNADKAVAEYARAEKRGEVARLRNKNGLDSEDYARALLADGLKKGWL